MRVRPVRNPSESGRRAVSGAGPWRAWSVRRCSTVFTLLVLIEFEVGFGRIRSAFGWRHKFLTGANGEDGEKRELPHYADCAELPEGIAVGRAYSRAFRGKL